MRTQQNVHYEAPQAIVYEIVTEGTIALSSNTEQVGVNVNSYNDDDFV
jgi:hypothetical protein